MVIPDEVPVPRKIIDPYKERKPVWPLPEPRCWELGLEQEEWEAVEEVDVLA